MENLKKDLEQRWFLHQYTNEKVFNIFDKWWQNFYFWVDCSSNSMTIWNFVALQMAIHFMLRWNKCYLLVWWATSSIWNPSWKDKERPILEEKDLLANQKGIKNQFELLVENVSRITWKKLEYEIVNNYDFFKNMNVLEFLKEVWRFMTVNWMISKDIVKKRIEDPEKWISYAEFSYMLIMWYDFYHLYKNSGVTLEVWWSDEWDWILSWIEMIGKKLKKEAFWVTNKLITDSSGKKFGKSEWNALWLDKDKTSPYLIYQYFMNASDEDVWKYLNLFTFLEEEEIKVLVEGHKKTPEKRQGQKILAYKVVEMIHGSKEAELALKISDFMFWDIEDKIGFVEKLTKKEILSFKDALWGFSHSWENFFETIVKSWLESSNSSSRNAVKAGSIYVNEQRVEDFNFKISDSFLENKVLLLRKWKKNFRLVLGF